LKFSLNVIIPDFEGPDAEKPISALAFDGDAIWAASGDDVIKYIRGKEMLRVTNPLGGALSTIMVFGSQLLALTEDGEYLLGWDTTSGGKALFEFSGPGTLN
jgi:U3 small nucleolar RNA-associated protein 21